MASNLLRRFDRGPDRASKTLDGLIFVDFKLTGSSVVPFESGWAFCNRDDFGKRPPFARDNAFLSEREERLHGMELSKDAEEPLAIHFSSDLLERLVRSRKDVDGLAVLVVGHQLSPSTIAPA